MTVSRDLWDRAGRICCYCRKGIRRGTAHAVSYTTQPPRISHMACGRRAVRKAMREAVR